MTDKALNQGPADDATSDSSAARLKSFIERVERLSSEKDGIAADIRDVYLEAKSTGYDTRIMRIIVRLRKMDQADRQEQEELTELYKRAVGLAI